ncbi:MAG: hypothetical protein WC419_01810 [Candidatus Omnitrophota bacterium]|jgi:hypothetical protein
MKHMTSSSIIFLIIFGLIATSVAYAEEDDDIVRRHKDRMGKIMIGQIKLNQTVNKAKVVDPNSKIEGPLDKPDIVDPNSKIEGPLTAPDKEPFDRNFAIEKARALISQDTGRPVEDIIYMYTVSYAQAHPVTADGLQISSPGDYRLFVMFKDINNPRAGWAIDNIGYNPETSLWEAGGYGILCWNIQGDDTSEKIYTKSGTDKVVAIAQIETNSKISELAKRKDVENKVIAQTQGDVKISRTMAGANKGNKSAIPQNAAQPK